MYFDKFVKLSTKNIQIDNVKKIFEPKTIRILEILFE